MNKLILMLLFLVSSFSVHAQNDSLISQAQQRFPMLEVCQPPGFPEQVLCGQLMVFENHDINEGKQIPIDVRIIPALRPNPDNKTYLMHGGGPGGTSNHYMFYLFGENGPAYGVREEHDVIVMDFRGMGASSINCSAISDIVPMADAFVYDIDKIKECLGEVNGKVDLSLYNTSNVVNDIEQVRQWLKIEKLDFHGSSYGARVVLEYSRRFPDQLNSLILSGSVSPDFNYVNRMDTAVEKQVKRLINECKSDSICNTHYPNFGKELYEIKEQLKINPVKLNYASSAKSTEILITDRVYRQLVGHLLLNGNKDGVIPMLVHEAFEGNFYPLINSVSFNLSMPMFLSSFCPEEINRVAYDESKTESLFTEGIIAQEKLEACNVWPDLPNASWLDEPLIVEAPILLMTGEHDANTPLVLAESIASQFSQNSRLVVVPNEGHASSPAASYCKFNLIQQFLSTGDLNSLDTSCLNTLEPKTFVFALKLSNEDFKKYEGEYVSDNPDQILSLFQHQNGFYLNDEYSQYSGPSQLLYKGNDTFSLLDCEKCKIEFTLNESKVAQVNRVYQESTVFIPKNQ